MEDEERVLMARETQKHEERKRKAAMREVMLKTKQLGHGTISGSRKILLKVFIGYLYGIGAFSDAGIIEGLAQSIKRGDEDGRIGMILGNRIQSQGLIARILSPEAYVVQKFAPRHERPDRC